MFRNLLCVVGGVALGYYLANIHLEAKYMERSDQFSEETKEYYRKRYERQVAKDAELVVDAASAMTAYAAAEVKDKLLDEVEPERTAEVPTDPKEAVESGFDPASRVKITTGKAGLRQEIKKVNYNHLSTPPKVEEVSEEGTETSDEEDEVRIDLISKKDFIEDQFGYKQIMLTYWAGDDILSNEREEPITNAARDLSIGVPALESLKTGRSAMGDSDVIYIRNHSGKWEFEITRVEDKYVDVVGPISITEEAPQIDATE